MRSNKRLNLLLLIAVLAAAAYGLRYFLKQRKEGFESAVKCPMGYTFFTDKRGDSFCCRGRIDPYTNTCVTHELDADGVCAFKPGVQDPRNPKRTLAECAKLRESDYDMKVKSFCPKKLPYYATSDKCCLTGTDKGGAQCAALDAADKTRYCVASKQSKAGEQKCEEMRLFDDTVCPGKLEKSQLFDLPVICFGNWMKGEACIPDKVVTYAQKNSGIFKKKDINTWAYACNKWKKLNIDRDTTGPTDTTDNRD